MNDTGEYELSYSGGPRGIDHGHTHLRLVGRMRRADVEDTVHPGERVAKAGRFGEVPEGHLRGAVLAGNICSLSSTDQSAHRNATWVSSRNTQ